MRSGKPLDRIEVWQGDITTLGVDAIVNAANAALSGGGGVDGAIHRAAGPELLAECRTLGRCPTGEARLTRGYRLPARFVIHAVGPVWRGGDHGEAALLAGCYRAALEISRTHALRSIAFPGISTGIYGYPVDDAARVATGAVLELLGRSELPERVIFCTFDARSTRAIEQALDAARHL